MPEPYLYHYLIDLVLGDFLPALESFSTTIQLNPSCPSGYAYRGLVRKELRGYRGAYADLSKAIELNPCGDYYANRAVVAMLDPSIPEADVFSDFSQASILFRQQRDWVQYMAAIQTMQRLFPHSLK